MSAEDLSAQEAFERFEGMLRDWLRDSGGTRIDIDYHAIHRTGHVINWLTINGQRKTVLFPAKMDFTMYKLRPAQVDPHRGAWTYSHLWMDHRPALAVRGCAAGWGDGGRGVPVA